MPTSKPDAAIARLSSKFQISIPRKVREAQNWHAGQQFVFIPEGRSVVIHPVPALDDLRGLARGAGPSPHRDRGDRF